MENLVERAAAGKRNAMAELYQLYGQKMYDVALALLGEESTAAAATGIAFRRALQELPMAGLQGEPQFQIYAVMKTAEACLKRRGKGELPALGIGPVDLSLTDRYAFVLRYLGGLGTKQITHVLKRDVKAVQAIRDFEETRFGGEAAYKAAVEALKARAGAVQIPEAVNEKVAEVIDAIAGPQERKEKRMKKTALIAAGCVLVLIALVVLLSTVSCGGSDSTIDTSVTYYADIAIAEYGTITVQLDQTAAPQTVDHFVELAQSGFYDGLTFHRIMEGFMMQGGCPYGNDTGGADSSVVGEFAANGWQNHLSHTRGVISMARSSDYNGASSQFFIVHEDSTFLDGQYAAFGVVTEGIEIVDAICEAAKPTDNNGTIRAQEQPVIESITIRKVKN